MRAVRDTKNAELKHAGPGGLNAGPEFVLPNARVAGKCGIIKFFLVLHFPPRAI